MSKYPYVETAQRFARETATHRMTVLHDDGMYRHLRFQHHDPDTGKPRSHYWFDLITTPGTLVFRGDGDSYVFNRLPDMFEFFRQRPNDTINPSYWSEKLTSGRDQVMNYDQELLAAVVKDTVAEYYDGETIPAGLMDAIQSDVLDELCGDESHDRGLVDSFTFYTNDDDRYEIGVQPDFQFTDIWEWRCRDYDWWFLWACQAIVWGIAQYDAEKARQRKQVSDRRLRLGRLSIYVEPRDAWVGGYVASDAVYVLPAPFIVFRWQRTAKKAVAAPCTPLVAPPLPEPKAAPAGTPRTVDVHLPEPAESVSRG